MLHRTFGKTGETVSSLGLGCMRLPMLPDAEADMTKIDTEKAIELIRYAVDNGVTYLDTSYPYHGNDPAQPGESEPLVGKALRDGYRERVKLATKLPTWLVHTRQDMDRLLDHQLERLQTDHVDFYLVHNIQAPYWNRVKEAGLTNFLDSILKDGRVKHVGFSFHDTPDLFKDVMDTYDWSFFQHVYNYLDYRYQAGTEGIDLATSRNMGFVAMEPLLGGILVNDLPAEAVQAFENTGISRSLAEWALRWVWNDSRVSVLLSGMSSLEQVRENIRVAGEAEAGALTAVEQEVFARARAIVKSGNRIRCTECYRCSCPVGVDIAANFTIYNYDNIFTIPALCHNLTMLGEEQRAAACTDCGQCDGQCPEGISIREELKTVAAYFAAK